MPDPTPGDVHVEGLLTSEDPMPKPSKDEERKEFLDRCMGDEEAVSDYPDQAQRFAFCVSQWERKEAGDDAGDDRLGVARILKVDKERRIAYGFFSVIEVGGDSVEDEQGDVIKEGMLLDAVHEFAIDSRAGRIMHRGRRIADVVESVVFSKDVQEALGIDLGYIGWFGAMKFRDDAAWERVKSGELKAFSIGGSGVRRPI